MDSKVGVRPDHYATLGLTPEASGEEIEQAFARELLRPRPFGGLAELGLAYEVLRDPVRRRAYDERLGVGAVPQPEPQSATAAAWEETPYFFRARPHPAEPIAERPPDPAAPEPRPFIAAREPAAPLRVPKLNPDYLIAVDHALARHRPVSDTPERSFGWKRTAAIAGGTVLAVGLVGAWAGLEAGGDAEAQQAANAVTVALPKAGPVTSAVPAPVPAPWVAEARAAQPSHPARHVVRAPVRLAPEERATEIAQRAPEQAATEPAIVDPLAPKPAAAVAASIPLPNAVVARTISRIGYPCGAVASASAIEGEAGAFKVTCTSGHSYRAAPVGGRYRFKRMGER